MFQRPTSITVLAVIGVIFACFGLLCTPFQALGMLLPPDPEANELIESVGLPAPQYSPTARALLLSSALVSFLASFLLLVGSAGSFWMKAWARLTMNSYAVVAILNGLYQVVVQMIFVFPDMLARMPQAGNSNSAAYSAGTQLGGMLGALIAFLCFSIFPALILYFYNRAAAREAFAREGIIPIVSFPHPAAVPPAAYGNPYGAPPTAPPTYPPAYQPPYVPYGGQPYTPPPPPPGYGLPPVPDDREPLPPPPGSQPPPPQP
ncbi:hypothetical protein IT570_01570 [Candidatus Sumerlaeota bacterium]|nr:hypothetical protein [Candidatus Sumerlaeota bacterium]